MKQVIFLLFPGIEILDFSGPLQTFVEAKNLGCGLTVQFCSWQREIRTSQNVFINRLRHFSQIVPQEGDLIIIPGLEHCQYTDNGLADVPEEVFDWLRKAYGKRVQLCSVCTGAFVLAHAGLLAGKRCTTHWRRARELQQTYPDLHVETNRLFVYDRGIYTSAGIASGIDLSLALVEKNWGPQVTLKVSRELVVYMRRDGSHHQESIYLNYRDHINPVIHAIQDWLISHRGEAYTLESLAGQFGLSQRNLTRLFKQATGITIKQYATLVTLEHARNLLENPDNSVESTAIQCGFHDAKHLRRLWKKHFGITPSATRLRSSGHHHKKGEQN
jgi:transcriptional regulator GlxA family with amidase domain